MKYKVLNIISNCRTKKGLYQSVEKIDPFCNDSELPYIKLAVQKLCNLWHRSILTGDHNEDWYRVNVYGDLFVFIFNGQVGYETKRSECHSLIIKSLRKMGLLDANTKDVRLDFIFTNRSGLNDAFYCEDKPYERASKDNKKTRHLREQALNYWVSLLPYNECIEHITAVTCQFNKLKFQIAATKFIAGVTVRSALRKVRIPNNDQEGTSVADYLATVISLINFEIIKLMTDIAKEDNLAFFSSSLTPDICYRDDSSHSSQSSSSSSSSSQEWSTQERKARIMQKIDDAIATFDDNNMQGYHIVMDNAPIHVPAMIDPLIEKRSYVPVYLPPYSPELNPIEDFWAIVKSKVKRYALKDTETLTSRIIEYYEEVPLQHLQKCVQHFFLTKNMHINYFSISNETVSALDSIQASTNPKISPEGCIRPNNRGEGEDLG
ncbi:hypothetical protein G6F37_011659 [Rhizopus arrhizus]|nr:hypothetical protein G6F38_011736 [Rhizopus arrhizus]KAG1148127.1 hypothetical protein G6F37_011659 [Rhizopus arrhizus]